MSETTSPMKPQKALRPLRIVSSALFLLFGIMSAISAFTMTGFHQQNFEQIDTDIPLYIDAFPNLRVLASLEFFRFITSFLVPVVAIVVSLLGLLSKSRWLQSIIGFVLYLMAFPASWLWQSWSLQVNDIPLTFAWTQNSALTDFLTWEDTLLGWISLAFASLAIVVSIVASITAPKKERPAAQEVFADTTEDRQPIAVPETTNSSQSNLSNLPMFALIGAFIVPLAGIILGHLSLNYMKKGQLSTQNKGMATAGLIIGYAFVGLGFLAGLIFVIVLIVSAVSGF
jgi:hypothetical protein